MDYLNRIDTFVKEGRLTPSLGAAFKEFYYSYSTALKENGAALEAVYPELCQFMDCVAEQQIRPFAFQGYHCAIREPFDYYQFGLQFIRPLIDFSRSTLKGLDHLKRIREQLNRGENVIFFANHQGEPDPQIISLMLEKHDSALAEQMIFVAGHRVISDPMAVPFSKGRNLLCIFAKKYIAIPEEEKEAKLLHNKRTLKTMEMLLAEGGKCIYVAPAGGRDRRSPQGEIEVAPFDSQSIELFLLIARKAGTPTHFYPLALATYNVLPPPQSVHTELGEARLAQCSPVHLCFGSEIDIQALPIPASVDRHAQKLLRAEMLWNLVKSDYDALPRA